VRAKVLERSGGSLLSFERAIGPDIFCGFAHSRLLPRWHSRYNGHLNAAMAEGCANMYATKAFIDE